ncbi:hypothetical protein [Kordia sp.]|uniref:hypothetical protein n=1 Tax=Kordia sp. TaxID=1965332 RepID=UPI003D26FDA7
MSAKNSKNPKIDKTGRAEVKATRTCTWVTVNGGNSTMTVTNQSRKNELSIIISGVPDDVKGFINGKTADLNGYHIVPPNSPSYSIVGSGNFKGVEVTLENNTSEDNEAVALVVATNRDK